MKPFAPVAQWIEYCPPKAGVAGSIPAGCAMLVILCLNDGGLTVVALFGLLCP